MPRFEITGADRLTGEEHAFRVNASNESEAKKSAQMKNLLVASIRRTDLDTEVEAALAGQASDGKPTAPAAPPPAIRREPPDYREILTGAKVLLQIALVFNIVGVLTIIGGILYAILLAQTHDLATAGGSLLYGVVWGLIDFAVAAIIFMLAGVGRAVRDIAINSFQQ